MGVIRKKLRIGGMTCINCQNKIEHKLKNTAGIQSASVSYNTGFADISFDSDVIALEDIKKLIENLGYKVLQEEKTPETDLGRIVGLSVVIVALYVVLQQYGVLNLLVPGQLADTKMGYGMLFVVGLITSVHCIAMCGGINLSQCIPRETNGENRGGKLAAFRPAFQYNLGRVISYTVIGFFLGLLGRMIGGDSGTGLPILYQGILKIIAGIFMVIMGINMLGIFPWLRRFNLRMPKFLAVRIGRKRAASSMPLIVGLLNGLMPCGPLQSMQIVALASGSPFAGALSMLLFSLGTVPLMLGLGSLVAALGRKFSQAVMNIGAVLVVVLGLAMLSQGGSLSGLLLPDRLLSLIILLCVLGVIASIPFRKRVYRLASIAGVVAVLVCSGGISGRLNETAGQREPDAASEKAEITDGVQEVRSTLAPGRYPNITVQAGVPVKWVIDAPAGTINGCNYKMLMREYGIEHTFTEGENVIEFTPEASGTVQYTCWMGMIRGNIFVTDGKEAAAASGGQPADVPVPSGYQIPSDELAVAQPAKDENGQAVQTVSVELTEDGFYPAVIVAEPNLPVIWNINNTLADAERGTEFLVPVYSTKLVLGQGENSLYLYPQESFEVSTGDHKFYAYVKVVDDIDTMDEKAIRQEVDGLETLIYPDAVFESSGMSCCS
ncbi:MAG: sulfite exporter TauE/SafE family protein [Lachnospiraceae bacterium]|nr:sulfite exporter TauE/SafE family protein [Lachnospiraceae bacterium]